MNDNLQSSQSKDVEMTSLNHSNTNSSMTQFQREQTLISEHNSSSTVMQLGNDLSEMSGGLPVNQSLQRDSESPQNNLQFQSQPTRLGRGYSFKLHEGANNSFQQSIVINNNSQNLVWVPAYYDSNMQPQIIPEFQALLSQQVNSSSNRISNNSMTFNNMRFNTGSLDTLNQGGFNIQLINNNTINVNQQPPEAYKKQTCSINNNTTEESKIVTSDEKKPKESDSSTNSRNNRGLSDFEDKAGYFSYVPPGNARQSNQQQLKAPLLGNNQQISANQMMREKKQKLRAFKSYLKDSHQSDSDSSGGKNSALSNLKTQQKLQKKAIQEKEKSEIISKQSLTSNEGQQLFLGHINTQVLQRDNSNSSQGFPVLGTEHQMQQPTINILGVPPSESNDLQQPRNSFQQISMCFDDQDDQFQFDTKEEKNNSLLSQSIGNQIINIGKSQESSMVTNLLNKTFDKGSDYNLSLSQIKYHTDNIDYTEKLNEYNLNLQTIKHKRLKRKKCSPIEPDSNFKSSWDIMGLLLIMYEAIVIPYRVAFNIPSAGMFKLFEYAIDMFFLTDLCINLYTGYYKKGVLVKKRRHVMCRYLKTWFALDLIATFPYAWVIGDITHYDLIEDEILAYRTSFVPQTSQLLRLLKIIRFLRIIRLIRLLKLRGLVNRFEEVFFNDTVSTFMALLKVLLVVFFIVHWAACIFFFIGDIGRYKGLNNWIQNFKFDKLDPIDQYVAAASWALTTMTTVGYGDIGPVNEFEQIFATFCMIVACGVFAFIIGSLSTIIDNKSAMIQDFKEKILQINQFLIHNKIPREFRMKIRSYLHYLLDNKKQYKLEEEDVLEMLNENLRLEATIHLNGKILHDTPIFQLFDILFLSQLTFIIKKRIFTVDEMVFEEGNTEDSSLYYIQKGNVFLIHKRSNTFIKELGPDDFFGECAFYSGQPRTVSARSKNFSEFITLFKSDFLAQAEEFPSVMQIFKKIQSQICDKGDYSMIQIQCYACEQIGHISIYCPTKFGEMMGNLPQLVSKEKHKGRHQNVTISNIDGRTSTQQIRMGTAKFSDDYFDRQFSGQQQDSSDDEIRYRTSDTPLKRGLNILKSGILSDQIRSKGENPFEKYKTVEQIQEQSEEESSYALSSGKHRKYKKMHQLNLSSLGHSRHEEEENQSIDSQRGSELIMPQHLDLEHKSGKGTWNYRSMNPKDQKELQDFIRTKTAREGSEKLLNVEDQMSQEQLYKLQRRHTKTQGINDDKIYYIKERKSSLKRSKHEKNPYVFNVGQKLIKEIKLKKGGEFKDLVSNTQLIHQSSQFMRQRSKNIQREELKSVEDFNQKLRNNQLYLEEEKNLITPSNKRYRDSFNDNF